MEIKRFNEYTKDEQVELLNHWWNYYGKTPYNITELEQFNKLLEEDIEFVRKCALVAYTGGVASQDIINAWRNGVFPKYQASINKFTASDAFKENEEEIEEDFIAEMVKSYNDPEPDVPFAADQIMECIESLIGDDVSDFAIVCISPFDFVKKDDKNKEETILTSENVHNTYKECLLKDEEVADNSPLVDFVIGEGISHAGVFNSERLEANREKIANMVDEIASIENGPSFLNMCVDKNGNLWTGDQGTVDLLVQLGTATEALSYPLPRDMWEALPGGVPLVVRNHEKDNEQLRSYAPKEFKKIVSDFQNGSYKSGENAE